MTTYNDVAQSTVFNVLVEVDNLFFNGIRIAADIIQSRYKALGAKHVDDYTFLRQAYGRSYIKGLTSVLPNVNQDTLEEVAEEINASHIAQMQQKLKLPEELKNLIRNARAEDLRVGLVTRLNQATAEDLFAHFIDGDDCAVYTDQSRTAGVVPYETWRRVIERAEISTRNSFAVCASGSAMRGALCNGLHSVIRLDPMLAFEDCAGTDLLVDKFDKHTFPKVASLLQRI